MKAINVNSNFSEIFAKYDTKEEVRNLANSLVKAVKEAHDNRMAVLNNLTDDEAVDKMISEVVNSDSKAEESKAGEAKRGRKKKSEIVEKAVEAARKIVKGFKDSEKPKQELEKPQEAEKKEVKQLSASDKKAIAKLDLCFEQYSEKSWVLRGDTKPIKEILKKEFNAKFNRALKVGDPQGWVIQNRYADDCAKLLGLKVKKA